MVTFFLVNKGGPKAQMTMNQTKGREPAVGSSVDGARCGSQLLPKANFVSSKMLAIYFNFVKASITSFLKISMFLHFHILQQIMDIISGQLRPPPVLLLYFKFFSSHWCKFEEKKPLISCGGRKFSQISLDAFQSLITCIAPSLSPPHRLHAELIDNILRHLQ